MPALIINKLWKSQDATPGKILDCVLKRSIFETTKEGMQDLKNPPKLFPGGSVVVDFFCAEVVDEGDVFVDNGFRIGFAFFRGGL